MPGVDRANGALCQFLTHAALLYYLGGAGKERGRRDLLGLARIDRGYVHAKGRCRRLN